jgi:hypothetical protein
LLLLVCLLLLLRWLLRRLLPTHLGLHGSSHGAAWHGWGTSCRISESLTKGLTIRLGPPLFNIRLLAAHPFKTRLEDVSQGLGEKVRRGRGRTELQLQPRGGRHRGRLLLYPALRGIVGGVCWREGRGMVVEGKLLCLRIQPRSSFG